MFTIAPIDELLAKEVELQLTIPAFTQQEENSFTGRHGAGSSGSRRNTSINVPFQFPPILKHDNKLANWFEKDKALPEPFAIFYGAKPRDISLKWSYVVTHLNNESGGNIWNIDKISRKVKELRSYFYGWASEKLIVRLRAYNAVGEPNAQQMTFRSEGVSVSHSDVVIYDDGASYPLRTDIDMKIKLWTNLGIAESQDSTGEGSEPVVNVDGLKDLSFLANNKTWY